MTSTKLATKLATMIESAEAEMAHYPQYAGHFADYRLVRIVDTNGLKARGRNMWTEGEEAIGKVHESDPSLPGRDELADSIVVYKPGYGKCIMPARNVQFVATEIVRCGRFSYYPETSIIEGPAGYMVERGNTRLASIMAGTDTVFEMGREYQRDPLMLVLVSLQTDFAAYEGARTLGMDGHS